MALSACGSSDPGSSIPVDDQPGVTGTPALSPDSDDASEGNSGAGSGDSSTTPEQGSPAQEPTGGEPGGGSNVMGVSGQALNLGFVQINQYPDDEADGTVVGSFLRSDLPVPTNLVLDVPGAQFPAFSNVSMSGVTPLTGVVREGVNTFRWNAGAGDPSVYISISLFTFSAGAGASSFPTVSRVGMAAVQMNDSVLLVSNSSKGSL